MSTHTLVRHADIQKWVSARKGQPAISRIRDRMGEMRSQLKISFAHEHHLTETPSMDDGVSPCSWNAWLAELDRQNLALKVSGEKQLSYEFIKRSQLN